jgi:hypothetical protein
MMRESCPTRALNAGWEDCIELNQYWFDLSRCTCKVVAAIVGRDRMEEIKFINEGFTVELTVKASTMAKRMK